MRLRNALLSSGDWINDIDGDNIPGQAGVDYPVHSSVPENTSFRCGRFEYAGYFADVEADCQVKKNRIMQANSLVMHLFDKKI